MGAPKALLPAARGMPLVAFQAALLRAGGCSDVIAVTGCHAREIDDARTGVRLVKNTCWELGRTSSVQAGLSALAHGQAALVLPVDTVGVRPATVAQLLREAHHLHPVALRPVFRGQRGRLAWLAPACIAIIRDLPPEFRLDAWLAERETLLEVDDDAILRNINTPADWQAVRDCTV